MDNSQSPFELRWMKETLLRSLSFEGQWTIDKGLISTSKFDLVFKSAAADALLSLSPHKRAIFCPIRIAFGIEL
jgi:hypothetical protein